MKRAVSLMGAVVLTVGVAGPGWAGEIDPVLQDVLDAAGADEVVSALVFLSDRVDVRDLNAHLNRIQADRWLRHKIVVETLQRKAEATQGQLAGYLDALQADGRIESFEAFWMDNSFQVNAVPDEIIAIAQRDDVVRVYFNSPIELIEPVGDVIPSDPNNPVDAPEPGIRAIQADRVWNELGIRGEGVLVATIDTGVDGNHPALKNRWRGTADQRYADHPEWAWWDAQGGRFPNDPNGHGTHTMGTVTGVDGANQIGVAPEAQWIAAGALRGSYQQQIGDAKRAFQWLADPDGNPNTVFDVPHVVSNSWGSLQAPACDRFFWDVIDASEAAGTVVVFSAGNEGGRGLRRPADRAVNDFDSCAVAACNGGSGNPNSCPIASFSSRGPTRCTPNGDPAIKPEITAPGVNVRSSLPGGRYGSLSGTSMASPHINGVIALMRQVNQDITSEEIKQIIYDTATDMGGPGNDNSFGHGLVNAFEAVTQAMGQGEPAACCFGDGSCADLLPSECRDRGGRTTFGESCDTVNCPQPGACCIDNSTCEVILERDCLAQGGNFLGEGESCKRACPCDLVRKLKAKCKNTTIKAIVKFKDDRRDGEMITIGVGDRLRFDVNIRGKKATLFTCCFNGPQTISLLDPEGCVAPKVVDCQP